MTLPLDLVGAREFGALTIVVSRDHEAEGMAAATVALRAGRVDAETRHGVVEWLAEPQIMSGPYLWGIAYGWWGIGRVEET